MKSISARDANQAFSKLLAEVEAGHEIIITRRGEPVARMVPVQRPLQGAEREAAIKRMAVRMRKGLRLGGRRFTRDEMHER
jgi:prevent-host-death family protein